MERQIVLARWSAKEDDRLKEIFPYAIDDELVKAFNKTSSAIKARAYRLGIKKERMLVQQFMKERSRLHWQKLKQSREEAISKGPSSLKARI